MEIPDHPASLNDLIDCWRSRLRRRRSGEAFDIAKLERELRAHIERLTGAGLAIDEAFLVAVKRTSGEQPASVWKQFAFAPSDLATRRDAIVAFCLAIAAAAFIKMPALFGLRLDDDTNEHIYLRNLSLFVLPLLAGYFAWKRRIDTRMACGLAVAFAAACALINGYPFAREGSTEMLAALHLPIALWLVVGIAYMGGRWRQVAGRMDFIRFSGELLIYYVLMALGGGVFTLSMAAIFRAIDINIGPFIGNWLLPCGATGAVLVASWLVESKQRAIENLAPMLTRLFTPLFAVALLVFLTTLLWTGRGIDIGRNALIAFDLLLGLIVALLLYCVSARNSHAPPGAFDLMQVVLIVSALLVDATALWAIAARIDEFGFSPNRVAALGENVILLVNLAGSAALYVRFLLGRGSFASIEKWQTDYLPVYAAWAAIIVIVFPPLFGYA